MQPQPYQPPPYQAVPGPPAQKPASRKVGCWIGLGCLGLLIAVALFGFAIFGVVMGAMRSSDAYQAAVNAASSNPTVVAELGAPIKPGWFTSGSINVNGSTGHADMSIPISGSVGSGKISAVADKAGGTWTFKKLSVSIDGKPAAIDLLPTLPP